MIALRTDNRILDTVIHGDALAVLKSMPNNSVDAIVTDPPSGISFMGATWDTFDGKKHRNGTQAKEQYSADGKWLEGRGTSPYGFGDTSISNSPKARDAFIAFLTSVMTEALRVLKPGGHALVWALPRTSHWTAMALEDAGFEVREKLYHIFGSGFPKSMAIDKAIDKMQGAEREVIGTNKNGSGSNSMYSSAYQVSQGYRPPFKEIEKEFNVTKPATPEAQQWQGWGTSTKPACEEWILVRKPLAEKSIAQNILTWGTGGLAIDKCRVNGTHSYTQEQWNKKGEARTTGNAYGVHKGSETPVPSQRWPANLLLSHSIWCQPIGVKRVRSHGHIPLTVQDSGSWFGLRTGITADESNNGYADQDGMETVEAWECSPYGDCPIAEMDRQSGVRPSSGRYGESGNGQKTGLFGMGSIRQQTYFDQGGASRYFQQFSPDIDVPFLYQSKASRSERNAGCEGLPEGNNNVDFGTLKAGGSGKPVNGNGQALPRGNGHPTVKSLSLMRWLIRLITPPGGVVLDCFAGSGSTLVACVQEGFHFIGIEQSEEYCTIANARIAHAQRETGHTAQASEEYECAEDCPVYQMNLQTGIKKRGQKKAVHHDGRNGMFALPSGKPHEAEEGYPSRYFTQFPPDSLFAEIVTSKEDI